MIKVQKQTSKQVPVGKERNYNEVIEFLNQHWHEKRSNLDSMKKLDKELGSPSQAMKTIMIGGTNGKSLTIHFIARLLKEEGLSVGALSSPHMLTYNERISINQETVNNKRFTELANEVINAALSVNITPHTQEILTLMALLHFKSKNVDVAVLETSNKINFWDPINICNPAIVGITRITEQNPSTNSFEETMEKSLAIAGKDTWVICADQSKLNLQTMQNYIETHGGNWAMPIRKLAQLTYPFEQLHGRCAALAERIAQIFANTFIAEESTIIQDSLLIKQKGQRGRPTLEAKRKTELNPKRTVEQFWREISTSLPSRFHILDKEKPTILLDNASNLDAITNLLLGIRLLHYQRTLKGLALIVGSDMPYLETPKFAKAIRYFLKKTSGNIILCPVNPIVKDYQPMNALDLEKIAKDMKTMKVKAKIAISFEHAFEMATKLVDARNGLLTITGSDAIIAQYWNYKGIKKL